MRLVTSATRRLRRVLGAGLKPAPTIVMVLLLVLAWAPARSAPAQTRGGGPAVAERADLEAAERLVGAPAGEKLEGQHLVSETHRVAALLRCPVCQGLSVADSPASMAVNMRHQAGDLLAAGFSEEQILRYFESAYGEFVRLEPPLRGINWSLWLAPLVGLLAGGLVIWWLLRGARPAEAVGAGLKHAPTDEAAGNVPGPSGEAAEAGPPIEAAPAAADPLPDDPDLAKYVRRVRELAYGWPDGVRPAEDETR